MIKFFITGGTIDGIDYTNEEDAPKHPQTHIPAVLKLLKLSVSYSTEVIFFKDSRFITYKDRLLILEKCKMDSHEQIIITHGTFTVVETAKILALQKLPKTMILVGSKIPVIDEGSDALENLLFSIKKVQELPHGVYIVMHSRIFNWDNAHKNIVTGQFEEIN